MQQWAQQYHLVNSLGRSGESFNITQTNLITEAVASVSLGAFSVQIQSNFATE